MARHRKAFGSIRRLPSGHYQARYTGPDLGRYSAHLTFGTRGDAEGWLAGQHAAVLRGDWEPPRTRSSTPAPGPLTLGAYAPQWLARRDLKPRTRDHYQRLLDQHILPALGQRPLRGITPGDIADWHSRMDAHTPTLRAHAYGLVAAVMRTAVAEDLIPSSPCRIRGGSISRRRVQITPASLDELQAIVTAMPERLRLMVLLGAWCALRYGELVELRRNDLDVHTGVVHVRRGVTFPPGGPVVGTPKTQAGRRDVALPPHLLPLVADHLARHTSPGAGSLLFPAGDGVSHLRPSSLARSWYPARAAAGRPDLRFHDLRHTGAVLAASTGATLAELMSRLGHTSPAA
ncbi:MAG: tyrosine-type recombinase/integrase, partial [Actinomycetes bacterium]